LISGPVATSACRRLGHVYAAELATANVSLWTSPPRALPRARQPGPLRNVVHVPGHIRQERPNTHRRATPNPGPGHHHRANPLRRTRPTRPTRQVLRNQALLGRPGTRGAGVKHSNTAIPEIRVFDYSRRGTGREHVLETWGIPRESPLKSCCATVSTFRRRLTHSVRRGPNTGAAAFNHAVWQPYSDHWVQLRTWLWRLPTSRPVEWSQDAAYEEIANGQAAATTTTTWFARGRHAPPSGRGARHLGRWGRRRAVA